MYDEIRNVQIQLEVFQKQKEEYGIITTPPSVAIDSQEVNVRDIIDVYYQGCGPHDIGNTMSLLGVTGGHTFRNIFYKNINIFTNTINDKLKLIFNEGLSMEIKATIKHLLKAEYSVEEIEGYMQGFEDGSCVLPPRFQPLPIVASYYMGWNKISTGRVYDSSSGHAFMIGCHSGNVISFGVLAKKIDVY